MDETMPTDESAAPIEHRRAMSQPCAIGRVAVLHHLDDGPAYAIGVAVERHDGVEVVLPRSLGFPEAYRLPITRGGVDGVAAVTVHAGDRGYFDLALRDLGRSLAVVIVDGAS